MTARASGPRSGGWPKSTSNGPGRAARGVRMSLQIVEHSQVGRAVCDYATEHGFDLLVVGRHGDGGAFHPRLGRVAETAVRGCAIPVLLL